MNKNDIINTLIEAYDQLDDALNQDNEDRLHYKAAHALDTIVHLTKDLQQQETLEDRVARLRGALREIGAINLQEYPPGNPWDYDDYVEPDLVRDIFKVEIDALDTIILQRLVAAGEAGYSIYAVKLQGDDLEEFKIGMADRNYYAAATTAIRYYDSLTFGERGITTVEVRDYDQDGDYKILLTVGDGTQ